MDLRVISEVENLQGKYVIIRSSCNVPLESGKVRNAFRLERALPTIKYLREQGARTIVISHIGCDIADTLRPVFVELEKQLPMRWGGTIADPTFANLRNEMHDGDILFCENLRQDVREEDNDSAFADLIASYGDIYVNDAFAEAHREHVSTLGLAERLPAYAGFTLATEVRELSKVMQPKHPALFLLGGAKFETKMPLVAKYLELYDYVFIGGALTNDVLKARGYEIGLSLVSDMSLKEAPFLWSEKLLVPTDVVVDGPRGTRTIRVDEVFPDERILDCGPETVMMLRRYIEEAETILWNGPFGNYEAGFTEGTEVTAEIIAEAKGFSVIGGGDTVAAVEKLRLNDKFDFVSIGGGSMLTLLEYGTTPVLHALCRD